MKILVVSNMYPDEKNPSYGIFVKSFCDELEQIGIDFDLSVMRKSSGKLKKILSYLKFNVSSFFKSAFGKYDIIYIHYASHSSMAVLLASKFRKLKVFTNLHGSDAVPENPVQEKFQKYTRKILKISEKVIVPSEYFREYVSDKYNINKNIIFVYPSCGINRNVFSIYENDRISRLKNDLHIDPDNIVFSYVGRITPKKGWDTFLKAVSEMPKNGNTFIMVGSGLEDDKCNKMIAELGLDESVVRYPLLSQNELADIYNVSDAFIFPTEREGESLGLVAIEAMACGTPVIASDFAAPKYYIKNEYNGFKFTKGDPAELAAVMNRFSKREINKKSFSDGLDDTVAQYDREKIREILKDVLQNNINL